MLNFYKKNVTMLMLLFYTKKKNHKMFLFPEQN